MYIENFWGGGVPPNTIMATLRGGGGIKVLKMYYVVCDWSLKLDMMFKIDLIRCLIITMIAKDPSYYWDHQSTWWTLGTIYTTHLKFYQLMNTARQVLRPASSRVIKIQVKRSFTPYIYCYNELKALLCFASLFLFNIQTLTWSKYFLLQRLILISYHLELDVYWEIIEVRRGDDGTWPVPHMIDVLQRHTWRQILAGAGDDGDIHLVISIPAGCLHCITVSHYKTIN